MIAILPYFLAFLYPAAAYFGAEIGGWGDYAVLIGTAMAPVLDRILPEQTQTKHNGGKELASLALWYYVVTQLILLLWAMHRVSSSPFESGIHLPLMISVGLSGAVGITAAHELIHRRAK